MGYLNVMESPLATLAIPAVFRRTSKSPTLYSLNFFHLDIYSNLNMIYDSNFQKVFCHILYNEINLLLFLSLLFGDVGV